MRKKRAEIRDHRRVRTDEVFGFSSLHETRGARESEVVWYRDLEAEFLPGYGRHNAGKIYDRFSKEAKRWLGLVGEPIPTEASRSEISELTRNFRRQRENISRANVHWYRLWRWAFEVGIKYGFLSPPAIAANFVAKSDKLHRLAGNKAELLDAVYEFADAWHWFHFEATGEHSLIASHLKGRAIGPQKKHEKALIKAKIISEIYGARPDVKKQSPKRTASELLAAVNSRLTDSGMKPMSEDALVKHVRKLVQRSP